MKALIFSKALVPEVSSFAKKFIDKSKMKGAYCEKKINKLIFESLQVLRLASLYYINYLKIEEYLIKFS